MSDLKLNEKYDKYDFPTRSAVAQPGHAGYLTPEQEAQVEQLRMMLESEGHTKRLDTLTLLRFLRARKFDVNLAKKMFVECEEWRKKENLDDDVVTWDFTEREKVNEYYPQYYHKTDKDGRPIYIESLGAIDIPKLYTVTTADRMLKNLAVEYERVADPRLPACSRKAGHLLETCCSIMDFKGVSITRAPQVYSNIQAASGMSQNYYPERLGKLFLINTPWGFSAVWGIVKGWLDPVTVQKIHVLGSGYKSELLKHVDAENLPEQFGGTCKCPGGCQYSDAGPWKDPEWAREAAWEVAAREKKAAGGAAPVPTPTTDVAGEEAAVKEALATADETAPAAPAPKAPAEL